MTKSVEEQAADDLDRNDGRINPALLDKGKKGRGVLGVDEGGQQSGLRQNVDRPSKGSSQGNGSPAQLQNSDRDESGRDGRITSVRQPEMREPEPSISGNSEGQRAGQGGQGSSEGAAENGFMSEGPQIHTSERETAAVQLVHQSEKSGAATIEKTRPAAIQAEANGRLIGGTFEEQYRLARAYSASGLMPKALNTPEKVLVALQMCRELNLPAMTSIGKIMVLNGTPSLFGEMPLALVRRSGLMENIKEEFIKTPDGEIIGARCTTQRKGDSDPIVREFTIEDAKLAKLWNKPGPWCQYPTRMLQLRARGWNLKDGYPDVLMGCGVAEFDDHVPEVEADQAPKLVERFK